MLQTELDFKAKNSAKYARYIDFKKPAGRAFEHTVKEGVLDKLFQITIIYAFWKSYQSRHEVPFVNLDFALNHQPAEEYLIVIPN